MLGQIVFSLARCSDRPRYSFTMGKTTGSNPGARVETIRASLERILRRQPMDTLELAREIGVREAELPEHLEHLERSLRSRGERLSLEAPVCLECDFEFGERRRYTKPGRCPECRRRRITRPVFSIVER
jgi:predicted Zn-ribbon and HTH transcriptional regulator